MPHRVILYFALPPAITEKACHALTGIDLREQTRVVMEKPVGRRAIRRAAAGVSGSRRLEQVAARAPSASA
jgi:glucose-6-phosphate 1-dehydrogenase